ncbi:isoprenylcysteine carboxyl methyltransferase family protein [Herbiconiux sp. SYSU D00978]|uniref:isoprenylcysteine carboxyl methyltransferase family protein n=1 Tax=Herbiconiux sp. SYSU D00978 TaxID=2812562 RepID=UPI0027DE45F3|nr:isoprenylcysteine carboxylmethyltransferase family protein [Herbiconiux sp. SYSU D00978]
MILWVLFILATGVERLVEMVISRRHAAIVIGRGGREYGRGQMAFMIPLHTALLLGCLIEPIALNREFTPWTGVPLLVIAIACQLLRYWCIHSLGEYWNTRVIVQPGMTLSARGPYRFLPHPNYLVVIVEGIALPLVYNAWITAIAFTVLNAVLLFGFRIPLEERALREASGTEVGPRR